MLNFRVLRVVRGNRLEQISSIASIKTVLSEDWLSDDKPTAILSDNFFNAHRDTGFSFYQAKRHDLREGDYVLTLLTAASKFTVRKWKKYSKGHTSHYYNLGSVDPWVIDHTNHDELRIFATEVGESLDDFVTRLSLNDVLYDEEEFLIIS